MGQILEALHSLQAVETQLATIRRRHEAKARQVEMQRRRVAEADERLKENQRIARERQVRLDALALDVAAREEEIAKQREALNKAKTNKEYAAILTAINSAKADNSKLESNILQLMEEIQRLTDGGASIEAEKARWQASLEAAATELRAYDDESRDQRLQLEASRDQCAQDIAPTALATFTRVAGRHDGEAMVPIMKTHPKRDEYICTGCNMKIALEVVNTLQTRDELQLCAVCGRVLYLEDAFAH
jgi:predicted  nucleic acid-binding Zn-ribbon protein